MKKSISEQVGADIAGKVSAKLGFITVTRPYDADTNTMILHRGPVATFLELQANQSGVWLFEIDQPDSTIEMHLVRWKSESGEWEYLGEAKGGIL